MIWSSEHQCQVFGVGGAQLFGCSLAPANFCRIPDWCAHVGSRLFALVLIHCSDDVMTVERSSTVKLAFRVWRKFAEICGWDISGS